MIPTEKTVTEWLLDAEQHKGELQKVAAAYRRQEREEKNLNFVRKKLDDTTGKAVHQTNMLTKATSKLHGAMKVAGGIVMAAGMARLASAMKGTIQTALDFEDWIGKDTAAIDGMRTATAGLISDLDLAKARTRLTTGDYKLQEEQLQAVAKAAIHLTRINKTSFSTSLDQVTKSIKTGSAKAMKELGFNVDLLGKSTDKTALALKLITERFGDTTIKAENTNEEIDKMKNAWEKASAEMGVAILQTGILQTALKNLTDVAKNFGKIMEVIGLVIEQTPFGRHLLASRLALQEADKGLKDADKRLKALRARDAEWTERNKKAASEAASAFGSPLFSFDATGAFKGEEIKNVATVAAKKAGKSSGQAFAKEYTKAFDPIMSGLDELGQKMQAATESLFPHTTLGKAGSAISGWLGNIGGIVSAPNKDTSDLDAKAAAAAAEASKAGKLLAAGPSSKWAGEAAAIAETRAELDLLIEAQERLNAILARGDQGTSAHYEAIAAIDAQSEALSASASKLVEYQSVLADASSGLSDMATGALSSFTSGLWAAADAAITGSETIGMSIAKMVKSVLLGVATQATVKAIFSLAEGFAALGSLNPASAAAHFTAAGMYAAVAVLAGAGGLAVSAGISSSTGSSGSASASSSTTSTATPTYGTKISDEKDINVNVYLGDPTDPGTVLLLEKQVRAMVA